MTDAPTFSALQALRNADRWIAGNFRNCTKTQQQHAYESEWTTTSFDTFKLVWSGLVDEYKFAVTHSEPYRLVENEKNQLEGARALVVCERQVEGRSISVTIRANMENL